MAHNSYKQLLQQIESKLYDDRLNAVELVCVDYHSMYVEHDCSINVADILRAHNLDPGPIKWTRIKKWPLDMDQYRYAYRRYVDNDLQLLFIGTRAIVVIIGFMVLHIPIQRQFDVIIDRRDALGRFTKREKI